MSALLKDTSWSYGDKYQQRQIEKYLNRANNHWRHRIALMERLTKEHAMPRLQGRAPRDITVVDVGCSIGTFAIEYARLGFNSIGVDFDPAALEAAKKLSDHEGVHPTFVCGDVTECELPPVDIAVCFDIFEHLHDDELGALLVGLRKRLTPAGSIVFHTAPSEADYVFYYKAYRVLPLLPFAFLPREAFRRLARAYMELIDAVALLIKGKTHHEAHKNWFHPNLLSVERLGDILKRAGYDVPYLDSAALYPRRPWVARWFKKHSISHNNIFGVAVPAKK